MGIERPTTIKTKVDFPVYGLDFTADDLLVAGGGGGANRSGVKNNLVKKKSICFSVQINLCAMTRFPSK
jgi:hypothetical protein